MSTTPAPANVRMPWTQFYCTENTPCPVEGTVCHARKYCIPNLKQGEACYDSKDSVPPFVARVDNVYTLFCDMPTEIKAQNVTCPLGCEKWEDCHGNICMIKKCNAAQSACRAGNDEMCMGVLREETFCYDPLMHGSKPITIQGEKGLSSSQIGGIAGGVSAAVVVLAAVGAFLIRRRRAVKAKQASQQSLPSYSAQDEKSAMQQATTA